MHIDLFQEEFEDTKVVIRIRKSKRNKQHKGQKKKDKGANIDVQSITHQSKDRVTWTPLKTGVNAGAPEEKAVPAPHVATFA